MTKNHSGHWETLHQVIVALFVLYSFAWFTNLISIAFPKKWLTRSDERMFVCNIYHIDLFYVLGEITVRTTIGSAIHQKRYMCLKRNTYYHIENKLQHFLLIYRRIFDRKICRLYWYFTSRNWCLTENQFDKGLEYILIGVLYI